MIIQGPKEMLKSCKPPNDFIQLKRSTSGGGRLKEKEVITGSATFEAGREYLVKTSGSSPHLDLELGKMTMKLDMMMILIMDMTQMLY